MKLTKFLVVLSAFVLAASSSVFAASDALDSEGYPVLYVRGEFNNWAAQEAFRMARSGDIYTITLPSLNGMFKIGGNEWQYNYGAAKECTVDRASTFKVVQNGLNIQAVNLSQVTLEVTFSRQDDAVAPSYLRVSANGETAPEPPADFGEASGTLPILYINVFNEDGTLNNEVIDYNLDHKNYFKNAVYWLDVTPCPWMIEEYGVKNIGSKDEPMPLEIKARGNFTRTAFAKKPFKLKLGAKQSMLGLSKSKNFAILAHADDNYGYMRNYTGFNLGRRIELPWTPDQQPVEVVINGNYRGLYFLTESIRVEKNRVDIDELDDYATDPALVSGGYIVELDNYDETNQIRMAERSCVEGHNLDMLRVTFDTPEEYSDIQRRFITEQFTAMNDLIGTDNNQQWSYLDMDDAARYYIVEEIVSNTEAYHGSTYLFRNRGEGQKWHFSPLWDFGNAFNGLTTDYFYNCDPFGNTWIPSMRANTMFNERVSTTWKWFMTNGFDGIYDEMTTLAGRLKEAAAADHRRWNGIKPDNAAVTQYVCNNTDMEGRTRAAIQRISEKIEWLKTRNSFGDFSTGTYPEPTPDTTPAAPLPDYLDGINDITVDNNGAAKPAYYNLYGIRINADATAAPGVYLKVTGTRTEKVILSR